MAEMTALVTIYPKKNQITKKKEKVKKKINAEKDKSSTKLFHSMK